MRAIGVLIGGLVLAGSGEVSAASVQKTVQGNALGVSLGCFRELRIEPSASLHGTFRIAVTADHEEELAPLLIGAPGGATLRMRPGNCWQPRPDFQSTLSVAIEVPAATPISLDAGGIGETTIGAIGGRITADLSGAGGLTLEQAEGLTLHLAGTTQATIGSVDGEATIEAAGRTRVAIGRVDVERLGIEQSGAGDVTIGGGRIGTAHVESEGAGQVRVRAVTGDATAEANGASHVTFARVTGRFEHETSGMATIAIER